MLASITEGVPDALHQLGVEDGVPFLAEYKYDGIRAQVLLCYTYVLMLRGALTC